MTILRRPAWSFALIAVLAITGVVAINGVWDAAAGEAVDHAADVDADSAVVEMLTGPGECAMVAHVFTRAASRLEIDAIAPGEWEAGYYAGDAASAASRLGGEVIAPARDAHWALVTDRATGSRSAIELRPAGVKADGTPVWVEGNQVRPVECPETAP